MNFVAYCMYLAYSPHLHHRHILYGKQEMETFPIMVDAMSKEDPDMEAVAEMMSMVQCMLQSATVSLSMS